MSAMLTWPARFTSVTLGELAAAHCDRFIDW
jgi:hypothetical protein